MKFRTSFQRIRTYSNSGSRIVDKYGFEKDLESGADVFKKIGCYNLYDQIQAYKDSVDLNKIIERFMLTGDPNELMVKQGFYADVTQYPQSYAELLNLIRQAKEDFSALDPGIRSAFNNDPEQFISAIGTEKFNSIFSDVNSSDLDVSVESEVSNES